MTKEIDDKTLAAREELAGHYKQILGLLGEDAEREGLIKTPERSPSTLSISRTASA